MSKKESPISIEITLEKLGMVIEFNLVTFRFFIKIDISLYVLLHFQFGRTFLFVLQFGKQF